MTSTAPYPKEVDEEFLVIEVCNDENCTRCSLIKEILALKKRQDVLVLP